MHFASPRGEKCGLTLFTDPELQFDIVLHVAAERNGLSFNAS
jgi:hypothetical protein